MDLVVGLIIGTMIGCVIGFLVCKNNFKRIMAAEDGLAQIATMFKKM